MSFAASMSDASIVSSRSEQIGSAVERTAVRFVRTWGFSTVEMVAARFRILTKATVPRESLTRRALGALPDVVWLDPTREWFSLLERESTMRASIEKIVVAVGVVERDELERALGKRHSFGGAPPAVVRAYVEALSAHVSRRGRASLLAGLTPEEHVVLEALERAGGDADLAGLRDLTLGRLAPGALTRVLQVSPLFLREGRGIYRVVGSRSGSRPGSRSGSRPASRLWPAALRQVSLAGSTTIVAPIQ